MSGVPIHPVEQKIFLRFEKVSFSYGKVKVLLNAGFHIHEGEFVALVGPNGSGKTTVLKLILGLETPQSGIVEIFGQSGFLRTRGSLGYVPQQPQTDRAFPITVRDVVKMGRLTSFSRKFGNEDGVAVDEALEQAEITELASRSYSDLSGGQRRRVLVARALASRPKILILDEPTANMDRESEERLYATLGKLKGNATILIVTHDMDFVSSLTDRVLCMGGGASDGNEHGIVQHRVEASCGFSGSESPPAIPEGSANRRFVLHGESIPADTCYDESL